MDILTELLPFLMSFIFGLQYLYTLRYLEKGFVKQAACNKQNLSIRLSAPVLYDSHMYKYDSSLIG